jgi:hypothetical protein
LRNKPDPGGVIAHGIALGVLLLFFIPISILFFEESSPIITDFVDFLFFVVIIVLPGWFIFLLINAIYWEIFGGETIHYTLSAIYIQQKKIFRREVVIPWGCVTNVEPYDEPWILFVIPTQDPTVCITYKTPVGRTKKLRFGFHLSKEQQVYVVERVRELCVESFE